MLVADDGSTDDTHEVISLLCQQESRLRYICQAHQGPSAARNLGIKMTQAPLIAFLDSDDEWLPGKLKAQIEYFKKNREVLICQTEEIWVRRGKRVNPMNKHRKYGGHIYEQCLPLSIMSPSCIMLKRELLENVGAFDEALLVCEDYDLWLRITSKRAVGYIERPYVVKYGGHSDQQSQKFTAIDQYRIYAMVKMILSGDLTEAQRLATLNEIKRKANIVMKGNAKRGRRNEVMRFKYLIDSLNDSVVGVGK